MNRLAELRAAARVRTGVAFRQKDLAQRLGVSRQTLAAWEQGTTEPTVTQALALASEFGVSVEELGYERESRGNSPAGQPGKAD